MRVYKYHLEIDDEVRLQMPEGAKILTVQTQNGKPCIWAAVNPLCSHTEERRFRIAGTGHNVDDALAENYVGTFQMYDGRLVFHVFEIL